MQEIREKLAQELAKDCKTVEDVPSMLKDLFKGTLQEILEAEMAEHLGYEKHSVEGNRSGNSRNGSSKKKIRTQLGEAELQIPRDRNGEFEPQIIKK